MTGLRAFVGGTAILAAAASASGETHELKLVPANVHWGYFDSRVKPVLKIASGDTVRVETMLAGGLDRLKIAGVPDAEIPQSLKEVEKAVTDRGPGVHPLTGPIYVNGAAPGDTLEVHILALEFLHPYGVTGFRPGGGTLPNEFPYARFKQIHVDSKAGTAEFAPGIRLKIAPFWGTIGVAPAAGIYRQSSTAPDVNGGNLDNKELVVGSILYLPVQVAGGLISIGDGHALQGDGEVTLTALETSLRGSVQIFVRKGKPIHWPRAETPTHFITMGLNTDLDEAACMATREMIDFLVSEKHLSRDDAYMLCSLAVDLRVTQLVDQTKGVHAMLPKSIFASK
jgi:acetamidase/formamidase